MEDIVYKEQIRYMIRKYVVNFKGNLCGKQINELHDKGYSYRDIYNALYYWYVVLGKTSERSNGGVGILKHIINDSILYWDSVWLVSSQEMASTEQKEVLIKRPTFDTNRMFDLE